MTMEVRCCCQPQKLLGWLPVPDGTRRGSHVRFAVRQDLELVTAPGHAAPVNTSVELPVETFGTYDASGERVKHIALKSEETPIDVLRRIRGFVENTDRRTL